MRIEGGEVMEFCNVRQFGATANGTHLDSGALQCAIDACGNQGGGTVYFPPGKYLTGTLHLRSHVVLKLETGAVLIGSPDLRDYDPDTHYNRYDNEPFLDRCLLYAEDCENIGFEGPGVIDGNGGSFFDSADPYVLHPMLIRMLRCRDISLRGLKIRMPAGWSTAFLECENIFADGVDIVSRHSNGDGLDFDSCRNVLVQNCRFDTSDDSICLQNSVAGSVSRNIVITNCIMKSKWAAVRIGLMSMGGIEDVTINGCVFHDIQCSGLKIQATESGCLRNMIFSNLVMRNVTRPIFLTSNYFHITKGAPIEPPAGRGIQNLCFHHISAQYDQDFPFDPATGIVLMGTQERPIEDIRLSDIRLAVPGGHQLEVSPVVNGLTGQRPEYFVFKQLPSYGIYASHLIRPEFENINLRCNMSDNRNPIFFNKVQNAFCENVKVYDTLSSNYKRIKDL